MRITILLLLLAECSAQPATWTGITGSFSETQSNVNNVAANGATSSGTLPLAGAVDELGLWNRRLSASEVTSLYNSGSGRDPVSNP